MLRHLLLRAQRPYTPTVRALGYTRQREGATLPARTLIVAMPSTPGQSSLPGVRSEAARASAQALHHAVRTLRDERNPRNGQDLSASPSFWAPFLHTGA
jgi:hypothetical protein